MKKLTISISPGSKFIFLENLEEKSKGIVSEGLADYAWTNVLFPHSKYSHTTDTGMIVYTAEVNDAIAKKMMSYLYDPK